MNKELQRALDQKAKTLCDLAWSCGICDSQNVESCRKQNRNDKWLSVKDAIVVFDETLAEKVSWRRRNKT